MKETTVMERADRLFLQQCPSMKEWVLSTVREHGMVTLDELGTFLPQANWAQLFLAIDRLSRDGAIRLRLLGNGEYLLRLSESRLIVTVV
jgi:hypothetical protein